MAANQPSIGTQHANIIKHKASTLKYSKFIQEKIKISNKIRIKQKEKIIHVKFKYAKATNYGLILV